LTFAIKDITLDLRAHVEFTRSEIRIRPAASNDPQASLFHLVFAAITRPMIEENATALADDPNDRQIDELKDDSLTEENRRQLEWIGVRTVDKLKELNAKGAVSAIGRVTGLPVDRLRRALEHASAPTVDHILPVARDAGADPDQPPLLRVRGHNLTGGDPTGKIAPRVTLAGETMAVVKASDRELLLAPQPHQWAGELSVAPSAAQAATLSFDLTPFAPVQSAGEAK
jgi:DNA-binding phage protein